MRNFITIKIQTMSNLYIGGMPAPFEIGGIDQRTAIDQEGFPCIPASSLKGTLRTMVREDESPMAEKIGALFKAYLEKEREKNLPQVMALVKEEEARKRINERYEEAIEEASAECIFGIKGFNNTPKLLFSDLLLCEKFRNKKTCFSIDMKNTIDTKGETPKSKPRTYQTAKSNLEFEGEIDFYKMNLLGEEAAALCREYVLYNLKKFAEGFYRLGNSKSRGYGKVQLLTGQEGE